MPTHSSHILELAKRGAEVRYRELLDEIKLLTISFPHLRDAGHPPILPLTFLMREGRDKARATGISRITASTAEAVSGGPATNQRGAEAAVGETEGGEGVVGVRGTALEVSEGQDESGVRCDSSVGDECDCDCLRITDGPTLFSRRRATLAACAVTSRGCHPFRAGSSYLPSR